LNGFDDELFFEAIEVLVTTGGFFAARAAAVAVNFFEVVVDLVTAEVVLGVILKSFFGDKTLPIKVFINELVVEKDSGTGAITPAVLLVSSFFFGCQLQV
jgi:hypothetical protein